MAVPNRVSANSGGFSATSTPAIAVGTVAVGDVVTISVACTGSGAVTIDSFTDTLGNSWTSLASTINNGRLAAIYGSHITVGGSCTVNITLSTSKSGRLAYTRWDGVAASSPLVTGDTQINTSTTSHHAAASPGMSPSDSDLAAVVVYSFQSDQSPYTVLNSFTDDPTGSTLTLFTYKTAASFSSERGSITSTGSGNSVGAIAFVKGLISGGSTQPPRTMHQFRQRA